MDVNMETSLDCSMTFIYYQFGCLWRAVFWRSQWFQIRIESLQMKTIWHHKLSRCKNHCNVVTNRFIKLRFGFLIVKAWYLAIRFSEGREAKKVRYSELLVNRNKGRVRRRKMFCNFVVCSTLSDTDMIWKRHWFLFPMCIEGCFPFEW